MKLGTVLQKIVMDFYGPFYSTQKILLTNHFIDYQGHDLGVAYYHLEFYPQGGSGNDVAAMADYLNFTVGENADDGPWHAIHKVDPYSYDTGGLHAHWAIPPDPGGHVNPGFAGYLRRYLGATDLFMDIVAAPHGCDAQ